MKCSHTLRISLLAAVCGLASSLAFAADPPPPPPSPDILRGPDIQDRDVPGAPGTFGEPTGRDRKRSGAADQRVRHRAFMEALRSLGGEEVAPDLRLTEVQGEQIKSIAEEFRTAMDTYRADHKAEIDALREKAQLGRPGDGPDGKRPEGKGAEGKRPERKGAEGKRPEGKGSGAGAERKPGTGAATDDPEVAAARAQLKAIREGAPKIDAYQTRMWAVLSAPQQALVQSRLDATQDRVRERDRGDANRRGQDRDKRAGDRRGPRPAPGIDDVNVPPPPPDAPMPEVH